MLTEEYYSEFLKSKKLKNGFVLTVLELTTMNGQMYEMKQMTEELILSIDKEIQKG